MKSEIFEIMKKTTLSILCTLITLLCSCSSKDATDLLRSVPKETGLLMTVNIGELNEKLKDGPQAQSVDINGIFSDLNTKHVELKKNLTVALDPESGVDFSLPMLMFERNNAFVVTFILKDKSKFIKNLEQQNGTKITDSKGVKANSENTVFISGDQAWLGTDYPHITTDDINLFNALKEGDSVLSLERVAKTIDDKTDISCFLSLAYLNSVQPMSTQVALALNLLFETPRFLQVNASFLKGKIEGNLAILNEKGKIANFSMAPGKINIGELNSFPGKGDVFMALATDSKLMDQLAEQLKSFPTLPPNVMNAVKNIDGNIVISLGMNPPNQGFTAQIGLKSPDASNDLRNLIEMFGNDLNGITMTTQGNNFILSGGNNLQGASITEVSKKFDGASFGIVTLPGFLRASSDSDTAQVIQGVSLMCKPKGQQLEFFYTVDTPAGKNSLLSLIELKKSF